MFVSQFRRREHSGATLCFSSDCTGRLCGEVVWAARKTGLGSAANRTSHAQALLLGPVGQFKLLDRVGGMLTVVPVHLL